VPWAPLKPSTIEAKIRAKRGSQGILRFSGALLRTTIGGVTPDNRVVFVGSTLPYAGVHQEGFSGRVQVGQYQRRPSVKQRRQRLKRSGPGISGAFFVRAHSREMDIPARPFLPEGPTAEGIAVQTLEDQLQDVINQGGR
jgi:phage gpG-like protein